VAAHTNAPDELLEGQHLDRYELVHPVARGGMACVWVAKSRGKHGFEKTVALKTILPALSAEPRFRRMFLHEAKVAAGIEHPNVAQILDLGESEGLLYVVMAWVDGESLEALDRAAERAGSTLPIPVVVRVMADLCAGLHAAHELRDARGRPLNLVHRDISPQNILISSAGIVKLIDFGVVKARDDAAEVTTIGTIKGKLRYMAPEQARGLPIDRRADIWAVGATLYRLLARRPAFGGKTPLSVVKRLTEQQTPEPLPPNVPWALTSIVLRALAFDPDRRYRTAAELGAALEALLQGPFHTTTREVATCVDLYLGEALSARRAEIDAALERCAFSELTPVTKPDLPVVRGNAQDKLEPPPRRGWRVRFATAAGVLTVISVVTISTLASRGTFTPRPATRPGLQPRPVTEPPRLHASTPAIATPPLRSPQQTPATGQLLPLSLQRPPLSVQALPILEEAPTAAAQSSVVKAGRLASKPSSNRRPVAAGPHSRGGPRTAPSGRRAVAATPAQVGIDDGF
jgi:eukaryotic-like serine/threonine-protein kinase